MGPTGTGKSTVIDKLAPGTVAIGNDMSSCTTNVSFVNAEVDGTCVTLIDTPGFDDTNVDDVDILRQIANALELAYQEKWQLAGIIYMHRILDNRIGGVSESNLHMFQSLCGENAMRSVVLCTSMWDRVRWSAKEERDAVAREQGLKDGVWAGMLAKGATVGRFDNTEESAAALVRLLLPRGSVEPELQTELAAGTALPETASGMLLHNNLKALERKHLWKLEGLRRDMSLAHGRELQSLQAEMKAEKEKVEKQLQAKTRLVENRDREIKELKEKLKASRKCC
ncbi:hypothetical protein AURDEDRAFT_99786 [Auricularia subglabra TFB-10046 SS5]|nr:hypothetical protein AURDEDRAFT_99786 [Auricularia subglabra TFB-10046 SS5]